MTVTDLGDLFAYVDPRVATASRVHDVLRGGKDNFPADRAAAGVLLRCVPGLRRLVGQARSHLHAGVDEAIRKGVDQHVDLGCGIPQLPHGHRDWHGRLDAVHARASAVQPGARTLYVDRDRTAFVHSRALLSTRGADAVAADLADPRLLTRLEDAGLDLGRPVAVYLINTLEYLGDDEIRCLLECLTTGLPAGSLLCVATTAAADPDLGLPAVATLAMEDAAPTVGWRLRTAARLAALAPGALDGLLPVDPDDEFRTLTTIRTLTDPDSEHDHG